MPGDDLKTNENKICVLVLKTTNNNLYPDWGARWCSVSEAAGSNLGPGASCWKVGSYLPMPGGLQCSMHWFPPPVNYPSQYDLGC